MTDIAELGLAVSSDGVIVADKRLLDLQKQALKTETATQRLVRQTERLSKQMNAVGGTLKTWVTTPLIAAATAVTKFSSDFENSFADIRKTVDATEAEFERIEVQIRELSKTIPTSVEELNRLGGVAGQLGVESKNVVAFTKTIALLGDTTDIAGEQAALSLSRFMNIMGTSQDKIDRVGSTVVGLGNNFAAMESEIVDGALSLASFGSQLGFTEAQVLAYSAAIAASGGETEAASSAFQKTAITMQRAVLEMTKDLDTFAKITGMTTEEFSKLFNEDSSAAMQRFLRGLKNISDQGLSTAAALEELGLTDIRLQREFGKVIGNLDQLDAALVRANIEWEANTALTDEAAKRYETFNSRVRILWNNIKDIGIILGDQLTPIFNKAIDFTQKLLDKWSQMDDATAAAVIRWGAFLAVLGPALIVIAKVAPTVAAVAGAFMAATSQQFLYQMALAKTALASGTATAAQVKLATAMGVAASGFRGLIAMLGGPWVVAAGVAATALFAWTTRANEARRAAIDLTRGIEALADEFRELGEAQRKVAMIDLKDQMSKVSAQLFEQIRLVERLKKQITTVKELDEFADTSALERNLLDQEAAMEALEKRLNFLSELQSEYAGIMSGVGEATASTTEAIIESTAAIAENNDALEEQARKVEEMLMSLREERAALTMTAKEQAIYNITKKAGIDYTWEQAQALVQETIALFDSAAALEEHNEKLRESEKAYAEAERDFDRFQTFYNRGVERMRDAMGNFFQHILVDGGSVWDSLLDGFKRMLAEMIATAAANRVLVGVGLSAGSSSALAGVDMSSSLLSVGGVLTGIESLFAKAGLQSGANFMYGLQTQFANAGSLIGGGMGAGLALTAGAGVLGGVAGTALGESLFGKKAESAWGAALGGIAGAFFGGPIGSAIGAALGGALDAAFGGDGKKRVTLGVETDPFARAGGRGLTDLQIRGASGILYTGRATRADEEAANELVRMFAQIDGVLTAFTEQVTGTAVRLSGALRGSSSQAGLAVQDSGFNSFFGSAEFNELSEKQLMDATGKFILAWLDAAEQAIGEEFNVAGLARRYASDTDALLVFIDSFGQLMQVLDADPIQAAVEAQRAANSTALQNYDQLSSHVRQLSAAYDGSLESTQQLTAALTIQQQAAFQLAQAYMQVQQQVDSLFGGLSESIRTSLMTQEELYNYERDRVHELTAMLEEMTDPESIMNTAQEIERRVSAMWGRLDEAQRQAMGPEFLAYIDDAAATAQERLATGLANLETSQEEINEAIRQGLDDAAERMSLAAQQQQAAAAMNLQAAQLLQSFAANQASTEVTS